MLHCASIVVIKPPIGNEIFNDLSSLDNVFFTVVKVVGVEGSVRDGDENVCTGRMVHFVLRFYSHSSDGSARGPARVSGQDIK